MSYQTVRGRKVRFALVGLGETASDHLDALKEHSDRCEIVDLCDFSSDTLAEELRRTKANGHTTLNGLLSASTADCVVLTTRSEFHPAQAIRIATSGRHVVTESPLATTWKEGRSIVEACDAAGVRLFIVEKHQPDATLQLVKRAIDEKRFGAIYAIAFNVSETPPQDGSDVAQGPLADLASYYIGLLSWMVGPVESVMAFKSTLAHASKIDGSKAVALRWRSGALGTLNMTFGTSPYRVPNRITVLGENGTVRVAGSEGMFEIEYWEFADKRPVDEVISRTDPETHTSAPFDYAAYYDNVIRTLNSEAGPETEADERLKALELATAVYLSARDGKCVALPLMP
jgi:UDP-N-acetyl-2-amino-2-deoxyglucuronate dehydrogenase